MYKTATAPEEISGAVLFFLSILFAFAQHFQSAAQNTAQAALSLLTVFHKLADKEGHIGHFALEDGGSRLFTVGICLAVKLHQLLFGAADLDA